MSWFYAHDGKQFGPVSDTEFESLIQRGTVQDDTLVWREGLANWLPYRQLKSAVPALPPVMAPPGTSPVAGQGPGEVVCAECRGVFREENAINYGTVWVCAGCKPLFVQRLKEGGGTPVPAHALRYAGFWIRLAARFIDAIIIWAVLGILIFVLVVSSGILAGGGQPSQAQMVLLQAWMLVFQVGMLFFMVAFQTFFIGRFAATPGKMAVGIKVIAAEGTPVSTMRAFGRAWADQLSSLTCLIGYIIAAFDEEKRALHDHICNTRVVYK